MDFDQQAAVAVFGDAHENGSPEPGRELEPPTKSSRYKYEEYLLSLRSNSFYAKFLKKSNRSAPPPAAEYGGLPRRKNFLYNFDFVRTNNFSS